MECRGGGSAAETRSFSVLLSERCEVPCGQKGSNAITDVHEYLSSGMTTEEGSSIFPVAAWNLDAAASQASRRALQCEPPRLGTCHESRRNTSTALRVG